MAEKEINKEVKEKERAEEKKKTSAKSSKKSTKKNKEAEKIHKLEEQIKEMNEKYIRLQAEFANYKRRNEKEKESLSDFVRIEVIKDLLPLKDDFVRLEEFLDHDPEKLSEGVQLISKKMRQLFDRYHVEAIPAKGEEFDPELHDAMMMQPVENEEEDGKILQVFADGYRIGDRVIRHSQVVVGKKN
jgi:molecular chaperone GrpE